MIDWAQPAAIDRLSPEERREAIQAEFARIRELPFKRDEPPVLSSLTARGQAATIPLDQRGQWRKKKAPSKKIAPLHSGPRRKPTRADDGATTIPARRTEIKPEITARCRALWDQGKSRYAIGLELFNSGSSKYIETYLLSVGVTREEMEQRTRERAARRHGEFLARRDTVKEYAADKHSVAAICAATGLSETVVRTMIKSN